MYKLFSNVSFLSVTERNLKINENKSKHNKLYDSNPIPVAKNKLQRDKTTLYYKQTTFTLLNYIKKSNNNKILFNIIKNRKSGKLVPIKRLQI